LINTQHINSILEQPQSIINVDVKDIDEALVRYPYCTVLHYIKALKVQNKNTHINNYTSAINPVLFHIALQSINNNYHPYNTKSLERKIEKELIQNSIEEESKLALENDTIDNLIYNASTSTDYFSEEMVNDELPTELIQPNNVSEDNNSTEDEKALMRVMSFTEWLNFLSKKTMKEKEEEESKRVLKAMWQKEKLAKALEDETDEIPEEVFNMAVNSITQTQDIVNESMADVYVRQGKYEKAIDIYKKLSLLHPEKNTYFANKIEKLKKEI
jgi:pentatricopeptide repeat protein